MGFLGQQRSGYFWSEHERIKIKYQKVDEAVTGRVGKLYPATIDGSSWWDGRACKIIAIDKNRHTQYHYFVEDDFGNRAWVSRFDFD